VIARPMPHIGLASFPPISGIRPGLRRAARRREAAETAALCWLLDARHWHDHPLMLYLGLALY